MLRVKKTNRVHILDSTGVKPTLGLDDVGDILVETDTHSKYEWYGTDWHEIIFKGALNVHDADLHIAVVNQYAHQHSGVITTLAVAAVPGDYQITVTSSAGFAVGDFIHLNTGSLETTHPQIISIVGPLITLDRRLDIAHALNDTVEKAIINMSSQAATMVSPQVYFVAPEEGAVWHITRLSFVMIHASAGDMSTFGNLSALQNGVVLRAYINGQYRTFSNWKTNGDIKLDGFDVTQDARATGGGTSTDFGTSGIGLLKDTEAIIRLAAGDRLDVFIQDNITSMNFFGLKVQGHIERE